MEKILALLNDLKSMFAGHGEKLDALAKSQGEVVTLKASVADLTAALETKTKEVASKDGELTDLRAKLDKSAADLSALQIAKDEAVKAEAKKANDTFAAMGIEPHKIPGQPATGNDIASQLASITDPIKRAQFVRANSRAIFEAARAVRVK